MARNQSALVNWSQYLALRGIAGFVQCFSVEQNLHTTSSVGSFFCRTNRARRDRAERNIAISFPDWSADRVATVTERSMQHMFQLFMVDALVTPRLITPHSWPEYITLGNIKPILDRLLRGEPMILLTGHCGNWELLGHFFALIGHPLVALARPIDNPLINDWLLGIREARGTRIVTKWGATPIIQETLQRRGRVGFIADQNAGSGGMFVPFFGRLASSYKSIGLLAMRYGVPIVAGCATRLHGRLKYELNCTDIITPDDWADQPDPLFYITARYNRAMERMIRDAPEQYLWLHRRWKSRPKHEREGKEFPRTLREKIEALPWMTEDELLRIVSYRHQE
jgi:Kdo2-lipid IVA lauroyltransferase/acyltransferase